MNTLLKQRCYRWLCYYTFFWSGRGETEQKDSGVGFAVRNSIAQQLEQDPTPSSDGIMRMRLQLQRYVYVAIVSIASLRYGHYGLRTTAGRALSFARSTGLSRANIER